MGLAGSDDKFTGNLRIESSVFYNQKIRLEM